MVNVDTVDLLRLFNDGDNEVVDTVELEIVRLHQQITMFSETLTPHKISRVKVELEVNMVNADTVDHLYFSMSRQ